MFKPVIKGRVGAQDIAILIDAVAEIEATVRPIAKLSASCRLFNVTAQLLAPALDLLIKYFGNIVSALANSIALISSII